MSTEITHGQEASEARTPEGGARDASADPSFTRYKALSVRTEMETQRVDYDLSYRRLILSGNVLEIFDYQIPVRYGFKGRKKLRLKRDMILTDDEISENRKRSKQRARSRIRRLVNANFGIWRDKRGIVCHSKFLTLTFRDEVYDPQAANGLFTKFIKRLNFVVFKNKKSEIRYLTVIEIQPVSKKIHYHVILFNLPYLKGHYDIIKKAWGQGFIWINKVTNSIRAAEYITKYLTKEDDECLRGEKSYFFSRGLYQPVAIIDEKKINIATKFLTDKPVSDRTYDSEHTGTTRYSQYDVKRLPALRDFIQNEAN